jgi:hypothetical protein
MKLPNSRSAASEVWTGESGSPLVVSIFYHDIAAADRAVNLVNRVTNNFNGELPVETHLWNFDVLRLEEVAEQAALKTAFADLVVVATAESQDLPAEVKRALEQALALRTGDEIAVVALLGDAHPQIHSSVCDYLKNLCHATEGCFFSAQTLPLDSCQLTPERIHERAEAHSSVLDGIMHRRLPQP